MKRNKIPAKLLIFAISSHCLLSALRFLFILMKNLALSQKKNQTGNYGGEESALNHKQEKLERPERLLELNPQEILQKIGVGGSDTICDIGAGSGVFTVPVSRLTTGNVLAVDINPELLDAVRKKAQEQQLENIVCVQARESFPYDIEDACADLVLLIVVLHEIADKPAMMQEIRRLLKFGGRLAVVEFKKAQTPYGPPIGHRISEQEILEPAVAAGFTLQKRFTQGESFEGYVFAAE